MTKVWMGFETFNKAYDADQILLTGESDLEEKIKTKWRVKKET